MGCKSFHGEWYQEEDFVFLERLKRETEKDANLRAVWSSEVGRTLTCVGIDTIQTSASIQAHMTRAVIDVLLAELPRETWWKHPNSSSP